MLTWMLVFMGAAIAFPLGWIMGCEWMQRQATIPAYLPSTAYADDFADHLSGRVYDQEHPPRSMRWNEYRDAS